MALEALEHQHQVSAEVIILTDNQAAVQARAEQLSDLRLYFSKTTRELRDQEIAARILDQIPLREITDREDMVANAQRVTFRWLFIPPDEMRDSWSSLPEWLAEKDGLYWITGKAGSSKSTLMKFLLHDPRTRRYLQQ
ncbi:hypothetical protein BBP40_002388 [Aspergillus hancockii]|nr:hypothetical protein BBP40_002388 [Aspergillus hancockii]